MTIHDATLLPHLAEHRRNAMLRLLRDLGVAAGHGASDSELAVALLAAAQLGAVMADAPEPQPSPPTSRSWSWKFSP